MKLSETQISKVVQFGKFPVRHLTPLLKNGSPLKKN